MKDTICHQIEQLRDKLGMSQIEFAKKFRTSGMTISRWERGQNLPDARSLLRLGVLAHKHAMNGWTFFELAGITKGELRAALGVKTRAAGTGQ